MNPSADTAPQGAPQGPALVRYTEPSEGAFSLVLPADWQVQGGVARGGSGARPWYRVLSPGGGAELRGSDPRVPQSFAAPSFGMMSMPGVPVRPYVPPVVFAEEYARYFAQEAGAARFEVTGHRDAAVVLQEDPRPESRQRTEWMLQQGAEVGGVLFACPDRGRAGLVDVFTLRMQGPFGLTWSPIVTAMIGPADAWEAVKATLLRIAQSFAMNPAWQQAQQQMQQAQHQTTMDTINTGTRILQMQHQSGMEAIRAAGQRAQTSARTSVEINDLQMQTWRQQQASNDEMQRRTVNAINERVDLYDPASGQVYRGAPAGYRTYWTDGADRVVASEGYENPDVTRFTQATDLDDLHPSGGV